MNLERQQRPLRSLVEVSLFSMFNLYLYYTTTPTGALSILSWLLLYLSVPVLVTETTDLVNAKFLNL